MSLDACVVRDHAEAIAADRLLRAEAVLRGLEPDRRRVLEQLAYNVAAGVAECLLEEAARNRAFAAALAAAYDGSNTSREATGART